MSDFCNGLYVSSRRAGGPVSPLAPLFFPPFKRMWCKVRRCRHPASHTTSGHVCGTCGLKGHGQMECGSERGKKKLETHLTDVLPRSVQCSVPTCTCRHDHTTDAHVCPVCLTRGGACDCAQEPLRRRCPTCRQFGVVCTSRVLFTGSDCVVCMQTRPLLAFECGHVMVCEECCHRL